MIPLFKPSIGEEELESIRKSFQTGWIGYGPRIKEFEEKFADYVNVKYAVGLNSATAALHLALKVLDIKKGDEVIVPSLTFVSSAHAVLYVGATPVFADVKKDTLCIDVEDIKKKITKKTKAIIPVHYSGHPCDMDKIKELAEEHNIKVIEDAAQATGAEYKNKKIGGISDITCFSFEAKKNLTTGEGGMLTTNNKESAKRAIILRWGGIDEDTFSRIKKKKYSWYYEVVDLGYKYHMNDIQAAIGIVQLKKLDEMNEKRRKLVKKYNDEFSKINWIEYPIEKKYVKSALWNYVIKVENRDKFIEYLTKKEISTGVHYMPVHLHPYYKNKFKADVPVTEKIWKKLVTLPLFPDLSDKEQKKVINAVKNFSSD